VNQSATYVNQLWNMLEIAHLILKCSRLRDESRGSHYKPEFVLPKPKTKKPDEDPEFMAAWKARNDKWLKNTLATWTSEGPKVEFKALQSLKNPILAPEPRHYD
jgi:succinate dehydrogenase / fumarate reductase flavoprotein subunit